MNNNLRNQLLKSGAVTKKKARKVQQELRQQKKQGVANNEASLLAEEAIKAQKAHTQTLNKEKEKERATKALYNQITQLLLQHQIKPISGDISYNFMIDKFIKYTYIHPEQQTLLAEGKIAIIYWQDNIYFIPPTIIDKISVLTTDIGIVWHKP